jgi:hypothetical protein
MASFSRERRARLILGKSMSTAGAELLMAPGPIVSSLQGRPRPESFAKLAATHNPPDPTSL